VLFDDDDDDEDEEGKFNTDSTYAEGLTNIAQLRRSPTSRPKSRLERRPRSPTVSSIEDKQMLNIC
jgi:hypothetical protein